MISLKNTPNCFPNQFPSQAQTPETNKKQLGNNYAQTTNCFKSIPPPSPPLILSLSKNERPSSPSPVLGEGWGEGKTAPHISSWGRLREPPAPHTEESRPRPPNPYPTPNPKPTATKLPPPPPSLLSTPAKSLSWCSDTRAGAHSLPTPDVPFEAPIAEYPLHIPYSIDTNALAQHPEAHHHAQSQIRRPNRPAGDHLAPNSEKPGSNSKT